MDNGTGGNPAGVVLDAHQYSQEQKQRIAELVGLSETAFVSPSKSAAFKLEFFTPNKQVPHCGHATIATFCFLTKNGMVSGERSSKETIDGNRDIFLRGDMAFMEQREPRYTPLPQSGFGTGSILSSLGITNSDLLEGHKPVIVNTGVNFLLVPVRNASTMAAMRPDLSMIERISEVLHLIGYYAFTMIAYGEGRDASTRMFAPLYGIPEESATGMAAGTLSCYLYDHANVRKQRMVIEQGQFMKPQSPSEIHTELQTTDGCIERVLVGGRGMLRETITVELAS